MSNTDKAAEALRLAEYMRGMVHTYPQMSEDEPGGYCTEDDQCIDQASALLREYATLLQAQPAEAKHIQRLESENEAMQAKIDALMLEFCPGEMTAEQLERWASHQKAALTTTADNQEQPKGHEAKGRQFGQEVELP